jgi:periplasmic divalent cation tolerance protein
VPLRIAREESMSDVRLLFVTISPEHADAYVRRLVEDRVVACGNILPGTRSYYWWEGEVQEDAEAILLMETSSAGLDETIAELRQRHPYDTPKIVAIDPAAVDDAYARWVLAQTRPVTGGS